MAAVQNWATTPRFTEASISTANTNLDGTGTIVSFFAAGTNGTRLDRITVQALSTTTAGKVNIFKRTSAGTWRFYNSVMVTAVTPSTTIQHFRYTLDEQNINLKSTDEFGASTHNAESFLVFGEGADF
jgi:hypothetical protein